MDAKTELFNELMSKAHEDQNTAVYLFLESEMHKYLHNSKFQPMGEEEEINKEQTLKIYKIWEPILGGNKATLISCGYPHETVVVMSEEDAESEIQAIT